MEIIEKCYENLQKNLKNYEEFSKKPLTLTEKILYGHLADLKNLSSLARGEAFLRLNPDRIAMQDATAQMAVLQFMQSGKKHVEAPTTIHCDHLIVAKNGAGVDLKNAQQENQEIYDFLFSAASRYGIGFWGPGSGIIHQVVLENYAFPGGLMIGTDSHTPNGGGLGMLAVGVGGADAVDVMTGLPWEVLYPKIFGICLKGSLPAWCSPKDIILFILKKLTVRGGTHHVLEYFGPGTQELSTTGKATITNMGAELGATSSIFPWDEGMYRYLKATGRQAIGDLAQKHAQLLRADPEVEKDPYRFYDQVLEIDLNSLEPQIVGPHTPDLGRNLSDFKEEILANHYPDKLGACLIGSCTNSSYEDLTKVAHLGRWALDHGLKVKVPFFISPGSAQILATMKRDGLIEIFEKLGGTILANACGPCIGQWKREESETNSIITSFNRNFRGRNDGNPETLSFIGSPEIVMALALSGHLSFDPRKDLLEGSHRLPIPQGQELPPGGFVKDQKGYEPPQPVSAGQNVPVIISETSMRLQKLEPFLSYDLKKLKNMPLLIKVQGKCTTDHISPAGKWLKFRGHLDKISDNLLLGAQNAFYEKLGFCLSPGGIYVNISQAARDYKKQQQPWVIIGDSNYGEGSSREHAAMTPRYLGGALIIAKSFARIHETNLKKQGLLALTFLDPTDYDAIEETTRFSVNLENWEEGMPLDILLHQKNGEEKRISTKHSYTEEQMVWYRWGSALNFISQSQEKNE